ncbi:hypothetical protein L596_024017 [Steinernema carpocapsae]|uniref:Thiamin pyrophosphokinase thiamin-binding domain-containing protein n=1 Tax=Steinernema carpocapsae TaxID=34508 RepID=A0A4U5MFF5_STECR|nr:hypothetical protein L596_024017 [Steinernema carpocapsae]
MRRGEGVFYGQVQDHLYARPDGDGFDEKFEARGTRRENEASRGEERPTGLWRSGPLNGFWSEIIRHKNVSLNRSFICQTCQLRSTFSFQFDFVVLLGGFSGRFDHILASLNSLLLAKRLFETPFVAIDDVNLITVLSEGEHRLQIDGTLTTRVCGLIPFCQQKAIVSTTGFRWNLEERELAFGGLISTSNKVVADSVWIKTSAPLVFTIELNVS